MRRLRNEPLLGDGSESGIWSEPDSQSHDWTEGTEAVH